MAENSRSRCLLFVVVNAVAPLLLAPLPLAGPRPQAQLLLSIMLLVVVVVVVVVVVAVQWRFACRSLAPSSSMLVDVVVVDHGGFVAAVAYVILGTKLRRPKVRFHNFDFLAVNLEVGVCLDSHVELGPPIVRRGPPFDRNSTSE